MLLWKSNTVNPTIYILHRTQRDLHSICRFRSAKTSQVLLLLDFYVPGGSDRTKQHMYQYNLSLLQGFSQNVFWLLKCLLFALHEGFYYLSNFVYKLVYLVNTVRSKRSSLSLLLAYLGIFRSSLGILSNCFVLSWSVPNWVFVPFVL